MDGIKENNKQQHLVRGNQSLTKRMWACKHFYSVNPGKQYFDQILWEKTNDLFVVLITSFDLTDIQDLCLSYIQIWVVYLSDRWQTHLFRARNVAWNTKCCLFPLVFLLNLKNTVNFERLDYDDESSLSSCPLGYPPSSIHTLTPL